MSAPLTTPLVLLSEVNLDLIQGDTNNEATRYRRAIEDASGRLVAWCRRRFDEYIDTRYYDARSIARGGDVDGQELLLDADLRAVTTLTNGDGATLASSAFWLKPRNAHPPAYNRIRLDVNESAFWQYTTDPVDAISVVGRWGWGGQWVDTGASLGANLDDSSTTATTGSGEGVSLEVGMVLKINSEYLYLDAISTDTLTLARAFNGSTAASHTSGDTLFRWQAHPVVQRATTTLVLWGMERIKNRFGSEAFLGDAGLPLMVQTVPQEVKDLINHGNLRRAARWRAV